MYRENAYLHDRYPEILSERVKAVVAKHGFAPRNPSYIPEQFSEPQLSLW